MYRIAGVKAQGVVDSELSGGAHENELADDSTTAMDSAVGRMVDALGQDITSDLLACVYTLRSDTTAVVRQAAVQVWKSVVPNTGRVLRDILPVLMNHLISFMSSPDGDQVAIAGFTLGDIVKKLGDRVLPAIVPILRKKLADGEAQQRQGVCLGLGEVIGACSRRQLDEYSSVLIPAVKEALCDPEEEVREAAAHAFNMLQQVLGMRAVDEILPAIMEAMDTDDPAVSDSAVHGLSSVLALRSKEILPYLIPKLTQLPMSDTNARALAAVAAVTTTTLHHHFNTLLPALFTAITGYSPASGFAAGAGAGADAAGASAGAGAGSGAASAASAAAAPSASGDLPVDAVTANIEGAPGAAARSIALTTGDIGVHGLLKELGRLAHSDSAATRRVSVWLLGEFAAGTSSKWDMQLPMVVKDLLSNLHDSDDAALAETMKALGAVVTTVTAERMVEHLDFMRSVIRSLVSELRYRKRIGVGSVGVCLFVCLFV